MPSGGYHRGSGHSGSNSGKCTKLFIGGLSFDTTDENLRNYFQSFGMVAAAVVMRDNVLRRSRGFGFVTFVKESAAARALQQTDHHIDGRRVEAKRAVPRDAMAAESSGSPSGRRDNSRSSTKHTTSGTKTSGAKVTSRTGSSAPRQSTVKSKPAPIAASRAKLKSGHPPGTTAAAIVRGTHKKIAATGSANSISSNNSSASSTAPTAKAALLSKKVSAPRPDTRAAPRTASRTSASSGKGTKGKVPGSRKIFVGGLHYDTKDATLKN